MAVVALALVALVVGGCGTKGSLGFKVKPTTTVPASNTTKRTQGDDSLEEESPPPPPADPLEDQAGLGAGLHHPGCGATTATPTTATPTTATITSASTTSTTRPPVRALVATPSAGSGPGGGC